MPRRVALLTAVELYQDSRITDVAYAEADVIDLSAVLEKHGFTQDGQHLLINDGATKTIIESKLRRLARTLQEDDHFVFFYAGHGFSANDHNYITAFDSQLGDLVNTSISLQEVFTELRSSRCRRVVMFLDSCESGLPPDERARYIRASLSESELEDFFRESEYCMCFASCKTEESSYPARNLGHGIWTYHLIEALAGNSLEAVEHNRYITAGSLQDYLSLAVPRTLRHTYTDPYVQTPWVYGGQSREFVVADVGEVLREKALVEAPVERQLSSVSFIRDFGQSITRLSGFRKHHHVPQYVSDSTINFAQSVAEEDIQADVEQVFLDLRKHFGYKMRDIEVDVGEGGASIICPGFDYGVNVALDPVDTSQVIWTKQVTNIRDSSAVCSAAFDSVFTDFFDAIEFTFTEPIEIAELIDRLEDANLERLSISCPYDRSYCDLAFEGRSWVVRLTGRGMIVQHERCSSPSELISTFQDVQKVFLTSVPVPILPPGDH